jgi:hypothetical protein
MCRQVAAHPALMAAIAVSSFPFLVWKICFIASLPHVACTLSMRLFTPPHFHDGWGFFHFVMLITEYYARKNVLRELVLRKGEGRTALIRHLAFPVWKARAHSSGVFVYWRHDESTDRPGCETRHVKHLEDFMVRPIQNLLIDSPPVKSNPDL